MIATARNISFALRIVAAAAIVLLIGGPALAQSLAQAYPNKPIRFILPFPPGGGTDIIGRILAERMSIGLGQPVVIENRGGAGGNIGAEMAAKSAPDGYTIVMVAPSVAISPALYAKLSYDPVKDFAPIGLVATVPNVMVIHPSVPAQTLAEFIALAKRSPGGMNFGSGGSGTSNHLAGELFNIVAGVKLVHVPYKGVNLAMNDVIGGQLQMVVIGITAAAQHIKSGRLRALAVITPQRSAVLPDVPTTAEARLPSFVVNTWYGLLAPAGTPKSIINQLNAELARIMPSPELKDQLATMATEPMTSTPEEFGEFIKREVTKWSAVVREAGLKVE